MFEWLVNRRSSHERLDRILERLRKPSWSHYTSREMFLRDDNLTIKLWNAALERDTLIAFAAPLVAYFEEYSAAVQGGAWVGSFAAWLMEYSNADLMDEHMRELAHYYNETARLEIGGKVAKRKGYDK